MMLALVSLEHRVLWEDADADLPGQRAGREGDDAGGVRLIGQRGEPDTVDRRGQCEIR